MPIGAGATVGIIAAAKRRPQIGWSGIRATAIGQAAVDPTGFRNTGFGKTRFGCTSLRTTRFCSARIAPWHVGRTGFAPDGIGGGIVIKALDLDDPNNGSPHHWAAACFLESGGAFAATERCKDAPWAKWAQKVKVGQAANKLSGERAASCARRRARRAPGTKRPAQRRR